MTKRQKEFQLELKRKQDAKANTEFKASIAASLKEICDDKVEQVKEEEDA